MEKISVSNVVEFKRKNTPSSQATLINKLKFPKPRKEDADDGGNYWTHSLSALGNSFRDKSNGPVVEKLDILLDKHEAAASPVSKNMFQKNIGILHSFEEYDFRRLQPSSELIYLKKPKDKSILIIEHLPIQALPNHVFVFDEDGVHNIGACWFVAKIKEYTLDELAIFTDSLHRYLQKNYCDDYVVNAKYCVVIDAMNLNVLRYSEIAIKDKPSDLDSVLAFMKTLIG
jgi:hypothetical protein